MLSSFIDFFFIYFMLTSIKNIQKGEIRIWMILLICAWKTFCHKIASESIMINHHSILTRNNCFLKHFTTFKNVVKCVPNPFRTPHSKKKVEHLNTNVVCDGHWTHFGKND